MKSVFYFLSIAVPAFFMLMAFFKLSVLFNIGFFRDVIDVSRVYNIDNFTVFHRLMISVIQMLPLLFVFLICNRLANLFALYEKGQLFELTNVSLIRQIGFLMILSEVFQPVYQTLMTFAMTYSNPVGQRFIALSFGSTNIESLLTGLIIVIASWIVHEASQLYNESRLTV